MLCLPTSSSWKKTVLMFTENTTMLINSIFIWWILSSDLPVSEHLRLLRNSLPNHGVPDNRDVGPVSRTPGWTVDSSHIISVEGREGRSVRERERERDKELWNGDRERQSLEEKERERHDGETNRNETKTVNSVLGSHWKRFYKKFRTISVYGGLQKYRDEYIFLELIHSSTQGESSYGHYGPLDHMSTDKLITETLWEDLYDMWTPR